MRVVVTGCGGFLGSEIVRQLIRRGDQVHGISRQAYPELNSLGMSHTRLDLSQPSVVDDASWQADAVIHTAAVAGVWGRWQHFNSINTLATQHVLEACRRHGVANLVFTSSPSVTFDGEHQRGVDESVPYPNQWLCHYPRTKALAEQAVLQSHEPDRLRTLALRPHLIWGEGDPHLLPRVIQRARSGRLRIVGDGTNQIDTVHVVNAAASHLCALDALQRDPQSAGGRAYFIAQDEPVNCWDWIAEICRIAGVKPPTKRIPFGKAYRIGQALETIYRWTGQKSEPPMTRFVAAQLAKDHYFDISAAKQRLGYQPQVTMEEGLQRLRFETD